MICLKWIELSNILVVMAQRERDEACGQNKFYLTKANTTKKFLSLFLMFLFSFFIILLGQEKKEVFCFVLFCFKTRLYN